MYLFTFAADRRLILFAAWRRGAPFTQLASFRLTCGHGRTKPLFSAEKLL